MSSLGIMFGLVITAALSASTFGQKYISSAKCIAAVNKCSNALSKESIHCKSHTYIAKQNEKCIKHACQFCAWGNNWKLTDICQRWGIRHACYGGTNPTGPGFYKPSNANTKATKAPTIHPRNATVPKGSDPTKAGATVSKNYKVVVCLSKAQPLDSWTKNGAGLVWKANVDNQIDPPGSGEICFDFRVPKTGSYYVTAITSAPRKTDNNDLWIKLDAGLKLLHAKTLSLHSAGRDYFKGYQNLGENLKADILSSVDRNPHIFVAQEMKEKAVQTICISGRSSQFTIYKIVLVHCSKEECNRYSKHIRSAMDGIKDSNC